MELPQGANDAPTIVDLIPDGMNQVDGKQIERHHTNSPGYANSTAA